MECDKKFKCPNCGMVMHLDGCSNYLTTDKKGNYDKWSCENCSHITLLDFRQ